MTKLEKAAETTKKVDKKTQEKKILVFAIVVPIVIALLVLAGAVIWDGIVVLVKTVVPSGWVVLAYVYIAFIAFLVGRISKSKKQ